MALSPMPPDPSAGAPSPARNPRDDFADYINEHNYIPLWALPDVAHGLIRHFGKTGQVLVHPHPSTGYVAGGVVPPTGGAQQGSDVSVGRPAPMARPVVGGGGPPAGMVGGAPQAGAGGSPLAGIRQASRSIFTGGDIGMAGPTQRPVSFVQKGGMMDGRGGAGRVPGQEVPASQKTGHDTVHAMLDPGELVANKKQLRGIQVKPGKAHLLRPDQKKAIKQAGKRNARRV